MASESTPADREIDAVVAAFRERVQPRRGEGREECDRGLWKLARAAIAALDTARAEQQGEYVCGHGHRWHQIAGEAEHCPTCNTSTYELASAARAEPSPEGEPSERLYCTTHPDRLAIAEAAYCRECFPATERAGAEASYRHEVEAERNEARAEVERLREALQPFVNAYDAVDRTYVPDRLSLALFERAVAALLPSPPEEGET